ncbi:hypothetical protein C4E44_08090 [Pseudomonas sp. MWU12-2312b]|uniref:hypothetical protein n=1 Tax=Pseudomonas moorei TaxID=395599 RepID=UPI000D40F521|nr:hypothetical protein [Pseudomonas moorei]PPA04605.1 hypothetical protein C4E44_08090 [Pseudomonas sp. MWU12-2312b]
MAEEGVSGSAGLWSFLSGVFSSPHLSLILGVALVAFGAAGGITYNHWVPVEDAQWKVAVAAIGGVLIVLYFVLIRSAPAVRLPTSKVQALGVKIVHPENNSVISGRTGIRGTLKQALPRGYELRILRGYPDGGFVPSSQTVVDEEAKTWFVQDFDIGGEAKDKRTIEAWIVGSDGAVLLDTWLAANGVHGMAARQLERAAPNERFVWLNPIRQGTKDMRRVAVIQVVRGD